LRPSIDEAIATSSFIISHISLSYCVEHKQYTAYLAAPGFILPRRDKIAALRHLPPRHAPHDSSMPPVDIHRSLLSVLAHTHSTNRVVGNGAQFS